MARSGWEFAPADTGSPPADRSTKIPALRKECGAVAAAAAPLSIVDSLKGALPRSDKSASPGVSGAVDLRCGIGVLSRFLSCTVVPGLLVLRALSAFN